MKTEKVSFKNFVISCFISLSFIKKANPFKLNQTEKERPINPPEMGHLRSIKFDTLDSVKLKIVTLSFKYIEKYCIHASLNNKCQRIQFLWNIFSIILNYDFDNFKSTVKIYNGLYNMELFVKHRIK